MTQFLSRRLIQILSFWLLGAWFILTLPVIGLLAVNAHSRFVLLEMATHYRARLGGLDAVFMGDSLTAGGRNWGWRMNHSPLGCRNLAGSGYTARQIQAQAQQSLTYKPRSVFVLAGTNDILQDREIPAVISDFRGIIETLRAGTPPPRIVVTLMPQTQAGDKAGLVTQFNESLRQLCQNYQIEMVDLNPQIAPQGVLLQEFTTDGVHFSESAYDYWASSLKSVLQLQPAGQ